MTVVTAFAALGVVSLFFSLAFPRANRFLYVGLSLLAFPIGFVLSYVIMATLYFLIIGPIAVIRRVFGRDAMQRRYDSSASSYWTQARPPRDKENYFHQF